MAIMSAAYLNLIELASAARIDDIESLLASNQDLLNDPTSPESAFTVLLYFLPESVPFTEYSGLISTLINRDFKTNTTSEYIGTQLNEEDTEAQVNLAKTYLREKTSSLGWGSASDSVLSDWIKARIRLVDAYTGLISPADSLCAISEEVTDWQYGILHVLTSFRSIYSSKSDWITLQEFEALTTNDVVNILLENTTIDSIVMDFNNLVVPYISYKNDFEPLWKWIDTANNEPEQQLELLLELVRGDGIFVPPSEGYYGFIRAVLAFLYMFPKGHYSTKIFDDLIQVEQYFSNFELLDDKDTNVSLNEDTDLSSFDSLLKSNLTIPTLSALKQFHSYAKATAIFFQAIPDISLNEVVVTSVYGNEEDQITLASKVTNDTSLAWLKKNVLTKLSRTWIDETLLTNALKNGDFDVVETKYLSTRKSISVTKHLLDAFYEYYDHATSCSVSRGGLKKAAKCLDLLKVKHSSKLPTPVERAERLLKGTDALSIYSLTLTPGVPLNPVELRIQTKDPLIIIHRLLELNPKLYLELDRLVNIASDLVFGITGSVNNEEVSLKVCEMCVDSSLANSNFNQAFEYAQDKRLPWTTYYQVGKFVSPEWDETPVKVLESQLELLGFTLVNAPKENLPEILRVWERLELQLSKNRTQSHVPTGFSKSETSHDRNLPQPNPESGSRKRDQLSGLLVSGLGWAIGANPR